MIEDILPYEVFPTFEDIGNWVKEKKEVYDELLTCGENEIVITYRGWFYDKIEKSLYEFYARYSLLYNWVTKMKRMTTNELYEFFLLKRI